MESTKSYWTNPTEAPGQKRQTVNEIQEEVLKKYFLPDLIASAAFMRLTDAVAESLDHSQMRK